MSKLDPELIRDIMAQESTAAKAKRRGAPANQCRVTDEQIKNVFNMFDTSALGQTPVDELELMLKSVGVNVSESDVPEVLTRAGIDSSVDSISISQFKSIVRATTNESNTAEEATKVFGLITGDSNGLITFENLKAALKEADARIPDEEIKEVLRYCALSDKAGASISSDDWLQVMKFMAAVGQ